MSSYQVFARKYRPQTFDSVVGQDHITQTLKNAIGTNRLAHAYLFVGPRGTGKTSTARILAKALNCIHGPTVNPCGICDPCREIASGNSLDVLEIDGASNNGVEQVRELRENVRFAPTRGKYKVYIIDEVHMLTTQAFNALLKTLEEPPEHVKFIFATTDVQKVLPTILSRCQRFDLRRIPADLIARHLQYIAGEEKIDLEEPAALAIAKGAEGGLRDAESMMDQLVAFCGERITEADVLSVFGFTASQTVSSLCDHLLDGNSPAALTVVYEQAEAGRDLSRLMSDLIGHLRNLLVTKADPNGVQAEVGRDELEALERQAGRIAMDRLLDLIEQFAAAEGRMKWAPNKKLHFEIAVIKAIQTLGQATLTEVLDVLTALKTGGELPTLRPFTAPVSTPSPAPRALPTKAASPAPVPAPRPVRTETAPVAAPAPTIVPVSAPTAAPEPEPPAPVQVLVSKSVAEPVVVPESAPVAELPEAIAPQAATEQAATEPAVAGELSSAALTVQEEPEPAHTSDESPSLFAFDLPAKPQVAKSEPTPEAVVAPPVRAEVPDAAEVAPWEDRAAVPEPPVEPNPPAAWKHPQELPEADDAPEADPFNEPVETQKVESTPEADSRAATPELWSRFIGEIRQKKPLLRAWVEAGTFIGVENGTCIIAFPEDQSFAMSSLSKPVTRKLLEEILYALTGNALILKLEKRAGLSSTPDFSATPQKPPADPMEEFKNDPIIRRALDLFKAEIDL